VEILLQNEALSYPDIKAAILMYLSQARPWPDKAINLIRNNIPINVLEDYAKQNETVRSNLEQAKQKNLL